ncbi:MAG: 23S rRNA (uracil(1939)-C(5))-methyltransferase RlmD, partial [Ruminococcus sp.]
PFDMFPQTKHVETLVVLSHKTPDSHIEVKIEFDNTSLDKSAIAKRAEKRKPKDKPIYKDIQDWVEKNYGFKVHTAYIAEVKRNEGLPMYDAPNAVEELKRPRPHPTSKMVEAIKQALKHFEII